MKHAPKDFYAYVEGSDVAAGIAKLCKRGVRNFSRAPTNIRRAVPGVPHNNLIYGACHKPPLLIFYVTHEESSLPRLHSFAIPSAPDKLLAYSDNNL